MFEDCETVDTITVETNGRETINLTFKKNSMQGEKIKITHLAVAVDILFKASFKGGKRYWVTNVFI